MRVPCALAGDSVVFPNVATKKRKYDCIECGGDVVVHRGPKLVAHFAHVSNGGGGCGGGESMVHKTTKEWIASIAASKAFVVWTSCTNCAVAFDVFRGNPRVESQTEWRWNGALGKYYTLDVALAYDHELRGVVEVWHTHEAGAEKRKTIEASTHVDCPVMEVRAVDLVKLNYPYRFESVSPRRCSKCIKQAILRKRGAWFDRYAAYFRVVLGRWRRRKALAAIIAKNQLSFDVLWAAVQGIAAVLTVELAIDAIVTATERVARRWLLYHRVKRLTSILNRDMVKDRPALIQEVGGPAKPTAKTKMCHHCGGQGRDHMERIRPQPPHMIYRHACPECCRQCNQCDNSFIPSQDFPQAQTCFHCNYKKKHGRKFDAPNKYNGVAGQCRECDVDIASVKYGGRCWECNSERA
jgi:hypothetical protein